MGRLEAWIVDQRWEAIPSGWRFRVEQAPDAAGAGNLARACRAEAAGRAGYAAACGLSGLRNIGTAPNLE